MSDVSDEDATRKLLPWHLAFSLHPEQAVATKFYGPSPVPPNNESCTFIALIASITVVSIKQRPGVCLSVCLSVCVH